MASEVASPYIFVSAVVVLCRNTYEVMQNFCRVEHD